MRKIAITLAAAAAAAGLAAPASATWYPQPAYGYGYAPAYGYGQGYGHHNSYAQLRNLQHRIDHLQREVDRLAQYRMISRNEYFDLRQDSRQLELRLRHSARFGLNPRETYLLQRQISRLEYKIARDVRDGRRWGYRW